MSRIPVWKTIALSLTEDIAEGRYGEGDRLPTEAQLAATHGVNRHTVRRALADLADQGLVHARRGAGVFVAARPTDYAIGKRVRFHKNIAAGGRIPGKRILALTTRAADSTESEALALPAGAQVHVYDGLSLADGQPIAVFQSVFPAARFPGLPEVLTETRSVTAALQRLGVADFTRVSTRLTARPANATQALHLRLNEGAPLMFSTGVNVDPDGRPVEYGRTWFAGDRVTLTLGED
ncbi:phosphonate metabolism transcriptional regulator PhnF [Ruegeria pomeroyi]|uniref:Transcriptional regulator, GntR family n=2 Tax=Ruegeria pomeroyi TaxID=89184 RepID=Q5LW75_RUEPO|nr:phosphonate metabolism transcriptional regulator PhnF [Ruegeria pomeroyi]HCE71238.1 phosphonate metabolism transcriptional regulator PhnF [Ruegeria sp.]AAV93785.1 transcriptional regulator, GntR family [Ruegeria pomeroyi DSS-3]NVK98640.1 phosphonate metabolism transcriptional regulator PhnF [Ruegeria pomeroyi]NVL03875.1 phosphonate metabolism transcriptional regulator PhnF [Ruegeria pomeroyi]QWV07374.1 phosphonate metabolism transcriptional regulator PhnF [Ruegeria pomeroyi]